MKTPPFDIVCFGSLTADLFVHAAESPILPYKKKDYIGFELGQKIKLEDAFFACGGGAANTSIGFAKLGYKAAASGVVGDDDEAEMIFHTFQKFKINTKLIQIAKGQPSSFSIILSAPDGRRVVLHRRTEGVRDSKSTVKKLPSTRAVYIAHLYDKGAEMLHQIPAWKEKNPNLLIGWNPGKTQFQAGLDAFKNVLPHISLLVVNVEEAELFTKMKAPTLTKKSDIEATGTLVPISTPLPPKSVRDVRKIAKKILSFGVQRLIVTDGRTGAQGFDSEGHHYRIVTKKGPSLSTLGAGDAFSVGALSALMDGKSLPDQLLWGTLNGYSVVQKLGAQCGQLARKELKKLLSLSS